MCPFLAFDILNYGQGGGKYQEKLAMAIGYVLCNIGVLLLLQYY
jgi:hypothetical protein